MRHASLLFALGLITGCGGRSHDVCPSEKHRADPDGRGDRCVDDRSTCDSATDCASADPCCTASCEDSSGDGLFECVQSCRQPECTAGACGDGWRCETADECSAWCVPAEVECGEGQLAADPTGTGNWICIDDASSCVRPTDCPATADGCCVGVCGDTGGGVFGCDVLCEGTGSDGAAPAPPDDGGGDADADADADGDREWVCAADEDCESQYGAGWTCAIYRCGGNTCEPPVAECATDADCVLAVDTTDCCQDCANAYSWDEVWSDPCLSQQGAGEEPADPPGGGAEAPVDCGECLVAPGCPDLQCIEPVGTACLDGQCVGIWE
jgi:hypothetical protein